MLQRNLFKSSLLTLAIGACSFNLNAAGFQLNEHSAAGLGRAFAGEGAMNDTAAAGSRNPAAIMMFDRPALSIGATYVDPEVNIKGTSPLGNSLKADDVAPSAVIPNVHFVMPINDKFGWGLSLTSNYGLSTEFDENYPAGSLAGKTELVTGNINLNGAYRLNQYLSFGLGVNAVYAKAKLTRHLGEFADLSGAPSLRSKEAAYLKGDKWGYGWNAGILYEIDQDNRFALTYRSKVEIDFDGDYHGLSGVSQPGSLDLTLPDTWEFSAYHKVAPKWAVHYGFTYSGWSKFEELRAKDTNGGTLFHKEEGFKNNIRMALGTTYFASKDWTLRAGIAYDDSAVPNNRRSISIPDQDRLWLTAGLNYKFTPNASVDAGFAYLKGQKVNFTEVAEAGSAKVPYSFSANGSATMYALNFNYAF